MDLRPLALVGFVAAACALAGASASGCGTPATEPRPQGQVGFTILHTADMHSRLFPYNLQLGQVDAGLGLGAVDAIVNIGGAARLSHIVGRERARASRVLHLDGGDCFQGAPVFNFYNGEAEMRTESAIGTDAMVVANHEFDHGAQNLATQIQKWATFPVLAANYKFDDPSKPGVSALGSVIVPFTVFDLDGLRIGAIGMGNLSSLTSIFDFPNSLNITPLNTIETAQEYVDLLRPLVDVVVVMSHLGIDTDEFMIQNTEGIDIVLGGHNHIVLQPPKRVQDCSANSEPGPNGETLNYILIDDPNATTIDAKIKRYCKPRDVVLAHSGAFAKYVGRLDAIFSNDEKDFPAGQYDPKNGFELVSHEYQLFPVTEDVPDDPIIDQLLEPYAQGLDSLANLDLLVGYGLDGSARNSTSGGDSPLGNLISVAMWLRLGIQTDFSLTNTTGIRTDLVPGPVTIEEMYNIFPFDNSITKMQLSGVEIQELFDFVARRSAGRGCVSQAQIAGGRVTLNCVDFDPAQTEAGKATNIFIGGQFCCHDADCGPTGSCELQPNTTCNDLTNTTTPGVCKCASDKDCPTQSITCGFLGDASSPTGCGQYTCDVGAPLTGAHKSSWQRSSTSCEIGGSQPPPCPVAPPAVGSICPANTNACDQEAGVCWQPIDPFSEYELATSNYLAAGGSGFLVLQRNTTQLDTKVEQRDALVDYIRAGAPCGADPGSPPPGTLYDCATDADCTPNAACVAAGEDPSDPNQCGLIGAAYVCACPEATIEGDVCASDPSVPCGAGKCILDQCRNDVGALQRATCLNAPTPSIETSCEASLAPCAAGGEQCKFLACVNRTIGNFADGRIKMVGQ
jgi:5'-nucleotidase